MANFLKDSMAELEHVVWPTHLETKNFLKAVIGIIIGMTLFTYILTVLFSNGIFGLRELIHRAPAADLSGSPTTEQTIDIGDIQAEVVPVTETPAQ